MKARVAITLAAIAAVAACKDQGASEPPKVHRVRNAGLELSATASGPVIDATLRNVSERPMVVVSSVNGGDRTHYDGYRAWLGQRSIRFTGARGPAGSPLIALDAGESVHHRLDLADWATADGNRGGPLPPGRHRVKLVYWTDVGHEWWGGELVLDDILVEIP